MRNSLYLLGPLDDDDVEWLLAVGRKRAVSSGETLIRQGEPLQEVYLTLKGAFRVVDDRAEGREIATLGSGEFLGEMSFVDAAPPSATVIATEEGAVLAVPRSTLRERLDRDTGFAARFYFALAVLLSDRLRATEASVSGAGARPAFDPGRAERDELDPQVLDAVHLAGARFRHIVDRLTHAR